MQKNCPLCLQFMTTPCRLACGHYVCSACLRVLKNKKTQMKKLARMKMLDNEMSKMKVAGNGDEDGAEDQEEKENEDANSEKKEVENAESATASEIKEKNGGEPADEGQE